MNNEVINDHRILIVIVIGFLISLVYFCMSNWQELVHQHDEHAKSLPTEEERNANGI